MINSEIRKVQVTGKSTFVVSLPKKWAVKAGITSGSHIHMHHQDDGSILMNANAIVRQSPKILYIDGKAGGPLIRDVIAAYVAGYRVIRLKAKNMTSEQKKDIISIVRKLIGIEIVEETPEVMVIQDISNPGDMPIDMSFRRMYIKTQWMLDNTMRTMMAGDVSIASEVIKQDDEIDRLHLLISKQFMSILLNSRISEKSELGLSGAFYYRLASDQLERIADHACKIASIFLESFEKIPPEMLEKIIRIGTISYKLINDSVSSFMKCDAELANRIIEEHTKISREVEKIINLATTLSADVIVSIGLMADSIKRIGDYAANIAELSIDFSKST